MKKKSALLPLAGIIAFGLFLWAMYGLFAPPDCQHLADRGETRPGMNCPSGIEPRTIPKGME